MKKLGISFILLFFGISYAFSQYDMEVLKYSQSIFQSDARSFGVANAYGAVGANFISSSINPAGLGLFRKGEFFFSTGFLNVSTNSSYLGNSSFAGRSALTIPSLGLVFTDINKINGKEVENGWVSQTFCLGLARSNSFLTRQNYSGNNDNNTILDYFTESAQGQLPKELPYLTSMAYNAWLIDNPVNNREYINALDEDTSGIIDIDQSKLFRSSGSAYDMNLAFAANYSNKLYLGVKIGIPFLDYYKNSKFTESNNRVGKSNYLGMTHENDVTISGSGFNAGLGVIYKPIDYLRLGLSLQSPTFFRMSEDYTDKLTSELDTQDNEIHNQKGTFEYSVVTPYKATLSMAIIAGNYGFISLDYEYMDYTSAYLTSNDYSFSFENENIQEYFRATSNLRIGAELKLGIFALRGGWASYSTPFNSEYIPKGGDRSLKTMAVGFGIREKDYYLDFGLQNSYTEEFELPYALSKKDVEGVSNAISTTSFIATIGFKF